MRTFICALFTAVLLPAASFAEVVMTEPLAGKLVKLALGGIHKEYPNKPGLVMTGPEDVLSPKELHPVFYGHFDWHSSVHGHWTLARLLGLYPEATWAAEVREVLDGQLTEKGLKAEAAYFEKPANKSFERMYGWAWALRLAIELRVHGEDEPWSEHFAPLEKKIVVLAKAYLPKLTWPIRTGVHPDAGWALGQFWDYSQEVGDAELAALVRTKAREFYLGDKDYPVRYEPSGNDFFSSGLNEADVMRRILPAAEFSQWLDGFFPKLGEGKLGNLLDPVSVSDVTDGHLIHLAGLNLSRGWTMRGIAAVLPKADPRRKVLEDSAIRHITAGMKDVESGHYEGEHWLGSFATYVLTSKY